MFEMVEETVENTNSAVIRVIGVGGGGGNAVGYMVANDIAGVEFICINTDSQALKYSTVPTVMQLGTNLTKGLGAGANPEVGRQAAKEDREHLLRLLDGADMVFITAGMGGGTGTGASPVIAEIAREKGILTVAVVTKPFPFEGKRRMKIAEEGIAELSQHVDSLITIPNEKLKSIFGDRRVTLTEAFAAANDVLLGAVQGIAELITRPGMINVDFADVRTVMSEKGWAMMGSGTRFGRGPGRRRSRGRRALPASGGHQSERRAWGSRQHYRRLGFRDSRVRIRRCLDPRIRIGERHGRHRHRTRRIGGRGCPGHRRCYRPRPIRAVRRQAEGSTRRSGAACGECTVWRHIGKRLSPLRCAGVYPHEIGQTRIQTA